MERHNWTNLSSSSEPAEIWGSLLSLDEVAENFGISKSTLYKYSSSEKYPGLFVKVFGSLQIHKESLIDLINGSFEQKLNAWYKARLEVNQLHNKMAGDK